MKMIEIELWKYIIMFIFCTIGILYCAWNAAMFMSGMIKIINKN